MFDQKESNHSPIGFVSHRKWISFEVFGRVEPRVLSGASPPKNAKNLMVDTIAFQGATVKFGF
jgi:hypothetical protein